MGYNCTDYSTIPGALGAEVDWKERAMRSSSQNERLSNSNLVFHRFISWLYLQSALVTAHIIPLLS